VFSRVWPLLSAREQRIIGPLLADFVMAFLEPDYRALRKLVGVAGLTDEQTRRVVEETHPRDATVDGIRDAAGSTLRLLAEHDVFDDQVTRAAFVERGLLGETGELKQRNSQVVRSPGRA
jgi:hypothetical protein